MTVGVKILHLTVIGPFVRNVEGGRNRTSIGIDASTLKKILVQLLVKVVNGIVESQKHNLWNSFDGHIGFMINV